MPYLGTYLTVLTMLDTALTDTVEVRTPAASVCSAFAGVFYGAMFVTTFHFTQGGLINFEKRRRVGVAS